MASSSLSTLFLNKKAQILELLAIPDEEYTDKSPKGSVDAPIINLIREINHIDGLVTTSSCSGRVSVFVEGSRNQLPTKDIEGGTDPEQSTNGDDQDDSQLSNKAIKGGPSGKGGGKWLFVSHDPVDLSPSLPSQEESTEPGNEKEEEYFTKLCGLQRPSAMSRSKQPSTNDHSSNAQKNTSLPRLIHLSYSPLILHVLTATLSSHARPLLSAAINAGFRESGVQSLSALDHFTQPSHNTNTTGPGTMVAIRTSGLPFETVIGQIVTTHDESGTETEIMEALVSEEYLSLCFRVVNERFQWNEGRKERLRGEIKLAFGRVRGSLREGKEERRRRKKEEGLERKRRGEIEKSHDREEKDGDENKDEDILNNALDLQIT